MNPGATLSEGTRDAGLYGVESEVEKQLVSMTPLGALNAAGHRESRGLSRFGGFWLVDGRKHPCDGRSLIPNLNFKHNHNVENQMPAYMIFIREQTLDRAELEAYWAKVATTLEGVPIKVLSAYGPHRTRKDRG